MISQRFGVVAVLAIAACTSQVAAQQVHYPSKSALPFSGHRKSSAHAQCAGDTAAGCTYC